MHGWLMVYTSTVKWVWQQKSLCLFALLVQFYISMSPKQPQYSTVKFTVRVIIDPISVLSSSAPRHLWVAGWAIIALSAS